jgi:hypothetical protein
MAVKAISQISGQFTVDGNMEITIPFYIKVIPGGEDGVFYYGPVAPNQATEANIVAWIKDIANSMGAGIGVLDTIKLVTAIGGLL